MTNAALNLEPTAEASIVLPRSKVAASYKAKYAEREAQMVKRPKGLSRKALARCNGDWLAVELAKRTLGDKDKLQLPVFIAILEANGIDAARWGHLNPGQQRMCGGLALRAVVAEQEALKLPGEDAIEPTRVWLAKHQH
jgi:hypothetical protein